MSRYAFLITSAINTKFGVFDSQQRLQQTIDTIQSIRSRVADAKLFLLEMAAIPLSEDQRNQLMPLVDNIIDFTTDPSVKELYNSTDNWDVVKNVTEVMCFRQALVRLTDANQLDDCQRVFKISGRYTLNDNFDIAYYDQYSVQSHYVISASRGSQFSLATTNVARQYMSRLWSWPTTLTKEIVGVYGNCLMLMQTRLLNNGYCDIEHALYNFLDQNKVIELPVIGIQGNLGPNGLVVKD